MAVDVQRDVSAPGTAAGTATYVYGVVGSAGAPSLRVTGLGGAPVRVLAHGEVAALASEVALPVRAKRRELLAHSDVLNAVVETQTVLPFRFGTTFADERAVVDELLVPRRDELRELLARLDGRVELTVRAFYVEEAILAEIVKEDGRVARLRELTRGRPGAATHGALIELGSAVAAALEQRTRRDAEAILDVLRPLALDLHVQDAPVEHQVLRASVLVERSAVPEVDAALGAVAARNAGRISFKYVGPLAPHSFVSLGGAL